MSNPWEAEVIDGITAAEFGGWEGVSKEDYDKIKDAYFEMMNDRNDLAAELESVKSAIRETICNLSDAKKALDGVL